MYTLDDVKKYTYTFRPPGIIIDTGVLVPLLLGKYDPAHIHLANEGKVKFSEKDIVLIASILSMFKKAFVTPHVIAELSNISKKMLRDARLSEYMQSCINLLGSTEEAHPALPQLLGVDVELVARFGFTDIGLLQISKSENLPVLTIDQPFALYAEDKVPVILYSRIQANELMTA